MKSELKRKINFDLNRYGYNNEKEIPFSCRKTLYGYKYTKVLRKCAHYKGKNIFKFIIYRLLLDHYSFKYGFQISYGTKIGNGLYLGHRGTIIINSAAVIGNNVNIAQGVTIGIINSGEKKGVPIIGNEVWIGANSTIVGGIKIGNDVLIAPNTFVNFDVPDHSLVINSRAYIKTKDDVTKNYVENRVE